jgi:hypothetical protein
VRHETVDGAEVGFGKVDALQSGGERRWVVRSVVMAARGCFGHSGRRRGVVQGQVNDDFVVVAAEKAAIAA